MGGAEVCKKIKMWTMRYGSIINGKEEM